MASPFSIARRASPLAVCVLFVLTLIACTRTSRPAPQVVDGVVDVSGWDFVRDGAVPLAGTWTAFWDVLPDADGRLPDGAARGSYRFPGTVRGQAPPSSWRDGVGQATFLVEIRGLDPRKPHALFVPDPSALVVRCVTPEGVAVTGSRYRDPSHLVLQDGEPYVLSLQGADTLTCSVVFDVLVSARRAAGQWAPPLLANAADAYRMFEDDRTRFAAFVAFLFTLGGFFLVGWSLRRAERAPLYVSLVMFGVGTWQACAVHLLRGESPLAATLLMRLQFGLLSIIAVVGCLGVRELLGGQRRPVEQMLIVLATIVAALSALLPTRLIFLSLVMNQLVAAAFVVLIIGMTIRALARKNRTIETLILSVGIAIAGAASLVEIGRDILRLPLLGVTTMGFMTFAFCLATVLARRSERSRLSAEKNAAVVQATNEAISRFVPREFLQALGHDDVTTAKLGDVTARDVTVLFADIRDFTSLSERLTPEATFRMLNECLGRLGPCVRAHGGFVDKYIGDAIMALFPGDPAHAVRAAIEMQRELGAGDLRPTGTNRLAVGIGIHRGKTMLGTIGESMRFEATVISDAVNVAARLEGLTKQLGCSIIVSRDVREHLDGEDAWWTRSLGELVVKGRRQAVEIVEVFAADDAALRDDKRRSASVLADVLGRARDGRAPDALAALEGLAAVQPRDLPVLWWLSRLRRTLDAGPIDLREAPRVEEK